MTERNNNTNRRINCFMFKIVRKIPLFTKEKKTLQAKLAVI